MKSISKYSLIFAAACSLSAFAGNEDRVGSAGASHLLVNPWARGSAIGDAGVATINGLEAQYNNIAGLAFLDKTQIKFNYSNWMGNAGISLNSAGFAQRVGESNVIAVSIQSMNYGDVPITTVANPEGRSVQHRHDRKTACRKGHLGHESQSEERHQHRVRRQPDDSRQGNSSCRLRPENHPAGSRPCRKNHWCRWCRWCRWLLDEKKGI